MIDVEFEWLGESDRQLRTVRCRVPFAPKVGDLVRFDKGPDRQVESVRLGLEGESAVVAYIGLGAPGRSE